MSEAIQKQLSNGAAQMSGVLLHAVDSLIKDKRGAKTVSEGGEEGLEGSEGGAGRERMRG